MNRTYKYILPALYLHKPTFIFLVSLEKSIIGAYIAKDGVISKDSVYVHLNTKTADETTLEVMINSHLPKSVERFEDSVLVELPHHQDDLTDKFLKGSYSKMYPEEVVVYKFPHPTVAVLTKSKDYKSYLENKFDVTIDDNTEFDSIPNIKEESFETNDWNCISSGKVKNTS